MKVLSEHERIAIVTISIVTGEDLEKVARAFLYNSEKLEDWIVNTYYKQLEV